MKMILRLLPLAAALLLSSFNYPKIPAVARLVRASGRGLCSGMVVHSVHFRGLAEDQKLLVSAAHCLDGRDEYEALIGGESVLVRPVLVGEKRDLAFFSPTAPSDVWANVRSVALSNTTPLPGDAVHAFVYPSSFELSLSMGNVASFPFVPLDPDRQNLSGLLAVHMPCTFGCSGGALLNEAGEMIGVLSLMAGNPQYHQFLAVPAQDIIELASFPFVAAKR